MFEFEYSPPLHVRLRIGPWHFRTWRSYVMRLPRGYRNPEFVYSVVQLDENGDTTGPVFGTFFSEKEAKASIARLEGRGVHDLAINWLPVHSRLQDWEFDL